MTESSREKLLGGVIGVCVGDAVGVPVEFMKRETLQRDPVDDMRGYGSHNQPPGTWSDDTSMTLCLLDSLAGGLNYEDIMRKLHAWAYKSEYTPYGRMFGIGQCVMRAMSRYSKGIEPLLCGGIAEKDNGNGSLMRILPLVYHLRARFGKCFMEQNEAVTIIHNVSALTHAHKRSLLACGIYISIAGELLDGKSIAEGFSGGINKAKEYYMNNQEYVDEFEYYSRIYDECFIDLPQEDIKSSGYVVDTLEAALWCLLNTGSYESCVLKAVNLGSDTDTIAAVAGGLAGIAYGFDAIPSKWTDRIVKLDYIKELCESYLINENHNS